MKEIGVVHKISKSGWATVRFDRKMACENCRMCFKPKDKNYVELKIKNTLNATIGDKVLVGMDDRSVLTASFLVYIIPLILTTIALGVSYKHVKEYVAIIILLSTLIISFALLRLIDRHLKNKKNYLPSMLEIIDNNTISEASNEQ